MKAQVIIIALINFTMISVQNFTLASLAQTQQIQFICGRSYNAGEDKTVPTTWAVTPKKRSAIIQWTKTIGSWTPQQRCEVISSNFQKAYQEGTIKYLTTTQEEGVNVICAAKKNNGSCQTVIMTLSPQDNPRQFLLELKNVLYGRIVGPAQHNSGNSQIYIEINLERILNNALDVEDNSNLEEKRLNLKTNQTQHQSRNYTGIVKKIDDVAQQITVRIDSKNHGNGSGVIIAKQEKNYYVLTAAHVVKNPDTYQLVMPNNKIENIQKIEILGERRDLAIITFNSSENYEIAELAGYPVDSSWIFVSGFPAQDNNKQRYLSIGKIFSREERDFKRKDDKSSYFRGQDLVYSNLSLPGMSGGAILDQQGRVIGINTGNDGESIITPEAKRLNVLGYGLGVSTNVLLKMALIIQSLEYQDKKNQPSTEISIGYQGWGIPRIGISLTTTFPLNQVQNSLQNLAISDTIKNFFKAINVNTSSLTTPQQQEELDQLLTVKPPTQKANSLAWINYGSELWRAFQFEEAIKAFDSAIKLLELESDSENLSRAYYGKGLVLWETQQYLEALEAFKKATENDNQLVQAWRSYGKTLVKLEKYEQAFDAYKKAIDQYKPNFDYILYFELAQTLSHLGQDQEAIEVYDRLISISKEHPVIFYARGTGYLKLNKIEKATEDFKRIIAYKPPLIGSLNCSNFNDPLQDRNFSSPPFSNPWLVFKFNEVSEVDITQVCNLIKEYNKANSQTKQFSDIKEKAHRQLGDISYLREDYKQAFLHYQKVTDLNNKDFDFYRNLANTSLIIYENIIANEEKQQPPQQQYFIVQPSQPNLNISQQPFSLPSKSSIFQSPNSLPNSCQNVHYNAADNDVQPAAALLFTLPNSCPSPNKKDLSSWQALSTSIDAYSQAITKKNNYLEGYKKRAKLYYLSKRYEKAISDYSQVIQQDSDYIEGYENRGDSYLKLEKFRQAIADYTQVINLDGEAQSIYLKRAKAYLSLREYQKAIEDYNRVLLDSRESVEIYVNRGIAYHGIKEYSLAQSDYEKALSLDKDNSLALTHYGLLNYEIDNPQKAINQWLQAIKIDQQCASCKLALATAFYNQGNEENAILLAQEAIKQEPLLVSGNPLYFKTHQWGEKLISDSKKLLKALQTKRRL